MYEQDWLMRQIQMIVALVAKMTLRKDVAAYHIKDGDHLSRLDYIYKDLETLLAKRELGKAEDLLFERLDAENPDCLYYSAFKTSHSPIAQNAFFQKNASLWFVVF